MLNYKAIEIFTNEDARYRGKLIADAVIDYIRDQKIAARCIVTRGIAGCYESGEVSTSRLEVLSYNLPIRIGRNVWLGAGVIVVPGVTIGDNSVIGAGSVVTKDIPANVLAFGVPCRVQRELGDADWQFYHKGRPVPQELLALRRTDEK